MEKVTPEEIAELNEEYEAQLKEDYEEYIKEIFVGIELFNRDYDNTRT